MEKKKELLKKYREFTLEELRSDLQKLIEQQFKLRIKHSIGELPNTHLIRLAKKNIARALTVIKEKSLNKSGINYEQKAN